MKRQVDRNRKEAEEYRVGDKVLISTKDFSIELRKRATKKLTEKFIGPYVVKKIVLENAVELELPAVLRIHPVVICRSTCPENYLPAVMSPPKNTSPPSIAATFLATRLMAVLQPSMYSVFHDGANPVSVSTLKLPLGVIEVFTTETPSISYIISLYIRLVVTL